MYNITFLCTKSFELDGSSKLIENGDTTRLKSLVTSPSMFWTNVEILVSMGGEPWVGPLVNINVGKKLLKANTFGIAIS